jgi:carbazole 1,9a-dioxygenase terminal dioxygenase component
MAAVTARVDPQVLAACGAWAPYVEAKLGFRNHWYPTLFSIEIEEGGFVAFPILGDRLLLTRLEGRVHALRDRCAHRGVAFSRKPECYAQGTITCWYHGFTYRIATGELCDILTDPGSRQIGRLKLPVFPAQEAQGLVFVFMGDVTPPPLADDVPPGFLDENLAVRGVRQTVNANWRVGCENGFDSTHVFIHKQSVLVTGNDLALPLGFRPTGTQAFRVVDDPTGPKGVYDLLGEHSEPIFDGRIDGRSVLQGHPGATRCAYDISIWLPGVLRVYPWPDPSLTQFEWYVPLDAERHYYVQTLGRTVQSAADVDAFNAEFETKWRALALAGFNDDDIWAREAQQEFYRHDEAWVKERLFEPDANIVQWRRLASRANRGIQRSEHLM